MSFNHDGRSSGYGARLRVTPGIPLNNRDEKDKLYVALWFACAGTDAHIPLPGDMVYYFPQGHAEQVQALCGRKGKVDVPNYNLSSKILCRVMNVWLKAVANTDEVYAEITLFEQGKNLVPKTSQDVDAVPFYEAANVFTFSKTLTASDTSTHGGFSVPKRHADECFPRLDMSLQPPVQELVAQDMNGLKWRFRHIYRGQPKRHLLTSGWSAFVSSKKLVAGDSCIFVRGEDGELRVGIRHGSKRRNSGNPTTSVVPENIMHHGIFATVSHAIVADCMFVLYIRPWASSADFVIPCRKYVESAEKEYLPGMRFGFGFDDKEALDKRHTGTIVGVEDYDGFRWPNSKWRCLKVQWDSGSETLSLPERLSPWEIKLIPTYRNDVSVHPLPKRAREIPLQIPGNPGMVKKGLMLNPRQKEVLQGQEISNAFSYEAGATFPQRMPPQLSLPPQSLDWKTKQFLQFPIYPSSALLEGKVSAGLSNPSLLSASSTFGNSSNSVSQDCVEQRNGINDEVSHRQPFGSEKFKLFGFELFDTHQPELPSVFGEVLSSHSARPISQPNNVSGLVSEKHCQHCSSSSKRSCIKVLKYGTALGRSVNLSQFNGYKELICELDRMFEFDGSLTDETSGWKLIFIDNEGDLMLVGDHEWQTFCGTARKIFIYPKEEINRLKPESLNSGMFSSED